MWRTTGCCGVVKGSGQPGVESECVDTTYFLSLVHKDSCFDHEQVRDVIQSVKIQFHTQREEPETAILKVDSRVLNGHTPSAYVSSRMC